MLFALKYEPLLCIDKVYPFSTAVKMDLSFFYFRKYEAIIRKIRKRNIMLFLSLKSEYLNKETCKIPLYPEIASLRSQRYEKTGGDKIGLTIIEQMY